MKISLLLLTLVTPLPWAVAMNDLTMVETGRVSLQGRFDDPSGHLVQLTNGNVLIADTGTGQLVEVGADGTVIAAHYPEQLDEGYVIRSLGMLRNGTPVAVFRHLLEGTFVTGFDQDFKLIAPAEISMRPEDAPSYDDLRFSASGDNLICLGAARYNPVEMTRTVNDLWLDKDFQPRKAFHEHTEGALLRTNPSEEMLLSYFHERLKGFFAPRTALGFLPDGTVLSIEPGSRTINRHDTPSTSTVFASLPKSKPSGKLATRPVLESLRKTLLLHLPDLASQLTDAWFDAHETLWTSDTFQPPSAWAIFPIGEHAVGILTDYDMTSKQQTMTLLDLNGQLIGTVTLPGNGWMTPHRLARFHVTGGQIRTLITEDTTALASFTIDGIDL